MKKIVFPNDELVHNTFLEWWYWNGHLWDKNGKYYSFMDCLFRINPKKVKLPLFSKIPLDKMYFSHSMIADISRDKFYPRFDYLDLVSKDSFTKKNLFINYTNPMTKTGYLNKVMEFKGGDYYLKNEDIELKLRMVKKPLLEAGTGLVKLYKKESYYYSFTNLQTEGLIKIDDKWIPVKGKSWMDHQWANVVYAHDYWDWFSVQLDNNLELVCFQYGKDKHKSLLATISFPNNRQVSTEKVFINPKGKYWKSKTTNSEFPLEWDIEIPEFKISFSAKAFIKHQEMIFGALNYWEGPLDVKAKVNNKKITGQGFAELVGYDSIFNDRKSLKDNLKDRLLNRYKKFIPFK